MSSVEFQSSFRTIDLNNQLSLKLLPQHLSHVNSINSILLRNYAFLTKTSSRPQTAGRHFVLMTTFPNKELTNEELTLEEAKLLNAVIVQRLK